MGVDSVLNVHCGLTENIYICIGIEVDLMLNAYCDCHGIYICVCGRG